MHYGAPCLFAGAIRARKSGAGDGGIRQAEAPFRQSGGLTIRPDIAACKLTALLRRSKGFALLAVIAWGPVPPIHRGRRPAFAPGSSAVSALAVFSAASDGAPN